MSRGNLHQQERAAHIGWVDTLGTYVLIKILCLHRRYRFKEVNYLTMSPRCRWIFSRWSKHPLKFKQIFLSVEGLMASDERVTTDRTFSNVSELIYRSIKTERFVDKMLDLIDPRYNRKKIDLYLKQEIAVEMNSYMLVLDFIKHYYLPQSPHPKAQHLVFLRSAYWLKYIREFFGDLPVRIIPYFNMMEKIKFVFAFVRILAELVLNLGLILSGKELKLQGIPQQPKIAIAHLQDFHLARRSDFFWLPGSGIKMQNVLLYFKYANRPADSETLRHLRMVNIPYINLLPLRISLKKIFGGTAEFNKFPTMIYVRKCLSTFCVAIHLFFFALRQRDKIYLSLLTNLIDLLNQVDFFESFFKTYKVKVHFALHETGRDMIASNIAMECVGGVDVGMHWSSYEVIHLALGKVQDVHFTWGPLYYSNYFDKPYYLVKNFVYTGYPFDRFFKLGAIQARQYRDLLLQNGAKFIISYFDQSNNDDLPLWDKELENFYQCLLELVVRDEKFGLIIKPKKRSPEGRMPNLSKFIQKAVLTRRCLILDAQVFPNEAALASDLAVAIHVASTPAVESALAGICALTYDPESHWEHPFYKQGYRKITFNNLEEFFSAVEKIRNQTGDAKEIGNYNFLFPGIDPFRDGCASQRMGQYMHSLIKCFEEGRNKEEAILYANKIYQGKWGENAIVKTSQREEKDHAREGIKTKEALVN